MGFLTIDYDYYKEIDEKTIRIFTLFNVLTVCAYSLRTKLFGQRSGRPTHRGSSAFLDWGPRDRDRAGPGGPDGPCAPPLPPLDGGGTGSDLGRSFDSPLGPRTETVGGVR